MPYVVHKKLQRTFSAVIHPSIFNYDCDCRLDIKKKNLLSSVPSIGYLINCFISVDLEENVAKYFTYQTNCVIHVQISNI